ncbi:MAG: hypothetical protein KAS65_06345 [Candidatus Aminicenantes bacterium]|nr:hypothetical protein [Candidatus Aminicenantes bacterium]
MSSRIIIGLGLCVFVSVALLVVSCKDSQVDELLPSGTLVEYQGCKEWTTGIETGTDVAKNQDCIEYAYDGQTLILKHVNAGFNCCPGEILADIDIVGNLITITENEQEAGCFCLCLFDLDFRIENLDPGEYTICIIEPYVQVGDEILEFTIQLTSGASGIFCLNRIYYPWGTSPSF